LTTSPSEQRGHRDTDSLLLPGMVAIKAQNCSAHLGLEHRAGALRGEAAGVTTTSDKRGWIVFTRRLRGACGLSGKFFPGPTPWRRKPGRADGPQAGVRLFYPARFLSLSDYWQGPEWACPAVADGAARSYLAALLSAISHSLATIVRLCERPRPRRPCWASHSALRCPGRPGAAGSSNCPRSFSASTSVARDGAPCFQLWFGTYFFGQVSVRRLWRRRHRLCGCRERGAQRAGRSLSTNARALGASRLAALPNRGSARDPACPCGRSCS